jgi:hypothetical protein
MVMLVFYPLVTLMVWRDQMPPRSLAEAKSQAWSEWVNMFWRDTEE